MKAELNILGRYPVVVALLLSTIVNLALYDLLGMAGWLGVLLITALASMSPREICVMDTGLQLRWVQKTHIIYWSDIQWMSDGLLATSIYAYDLPLLTRVAAFNPVLGVIRISRLTIKNFAAFKRELNKHISAKFFEAD